VSFVLIAIGVVLLIVCLAGVGLGVYMALDGKNRETGVLFALCWVSGAAGAAGVMMRDGVTVMIGALCFLVAGSVFVLFGGGRNTAGKRDRGGPRSQTPDGSDKTTRENKSGYKRAAS
jgi:hypothetical protein